jgi:hypothetical protein
MSLSGNSFCNLAKTTTKHLRCNCNVKSGPTGRVRQAVRRAELGAS